MVYERKTNERGNVLVFLLLASGLILGGFCYFAQITPAEFISAF